MLKTLTAGHIRDWMRWMAERGIKGGRINKVMQAMSVAVRYAVDREELDRDPFKTIHEASDTRREKGILTPDEVSRIIRSPSRDPRGRLAVLLGMLCGLRLGEVRGLLWGDIGDEAISVCHNYQNEDGLKAPKWGSAGTVPITASVRAAIDIVHGLVVHQGTDVFVMESLECPGQPFNKTWFEKALNRELSAAGIEAEEQKRRNLSFHSLRHTFVTLGRLAGISDLEIQALARHKSTAMMERYSHASQVLDFAAAREKLERAIRG
jgi:integrase